MRADLAVLPSREYHLAAEGDAGGNPCLLRLARALCRNPVVGDVPHPHRSVLRAGGEDGGGVRVGAGGVRGVGDGGDGSVVCFLQQNEFRRVVRLGIAGYEERDEIEVAAVCAGQEPHLGRGVGEGRAELKRGDTPFNLHHGDPNGSARHRPQVARPVACSIEDGDRAVATSYHETVSALSSQRNEGEDPVRRGRDCGVHRLVLDVYSRKVARCGASEDVIAVVGVCEGAEGTDLVAKAALLRDHCALHRV
mmetsp:Transcript_1788/g.3995  ORF Transcript_1788/g.3995 Transcript_1788/m.3995 type:complete len:251 (-) Transcript_1788:366-1118(-)